MARTTTAKRGKAKKTATKRLGRPPGRKTGTGRKATAGRKTVGRKLATTRRPRAPKAAPTE